MSPREIIEVEIEKLKPNPFQPATRLEVDEATAEKFGLSIQQHGLLQIPVARPAPEDDGFYEIGDGWRRRTGYKWLQEAKIKGYEKMPVEVKDITDQQMADLVIEANTTRDDLNPIDLGLFYANYLQKFPTVTQTELAQRHNKSQPEIANTMRLLDLPEDVQQLIISRKITSSHGLRLLQLDDRPMISRLGRLAVEQDLSASALDAMVKQVIEQQKPRMPEPEAPEAPQVETEEDLSYVYGQHKPVFPPIEEKGEPGPEPMPPAEEIPALQTEPSTEVTTEVSAEPQPFTALPEKEKPAPAPEKKPEEKKTAPPAAAAPAPTKPAWKRKLVLEEKEDGVMAALMPEGGFPVMRKIEGNLDDDSTWQAVRAFLAEIASEPCKEVK